MTCDCRYPSRKTENEADWNAKPTGNELWTGSTGRPWPPYPVWHDPACASLETYPLRPLAADPRCVKCGGTDIRTVFHEAVWSYIPHHHDYWRTDLYKWMCALTYRYRPVEHLDRTCGTCRWEWLEQTAEAAR